MYLKLYWFFWLWNIFVNIFFEFVFKKWNLFINEVRYVVYINILGDLKGVVVYKYDNE